MSDVRSTVFWQTTTTIPRGTGSDVPLPDRADIVIVGGGFTGVTAALFLSRAGARVVLLEAGSLGGGASSRNGGMIHGGVRWSRAVLDKRYGAGLGGRLEAAAADAFRTVETLIAEEQLDCDYVRSGRLVLAWSHADAERLERKAAALAAAGVEARLVRGAALRNEIGSSHYEAGLVDPEAGGVNPAKLIGSLADRALAAGADLRTETAALAIDRVRGGLRVRTARGSIVGRDVVVATDGHTGPLVPWLQRRVIPIGSYIVVTEPLDPDLARSVNPTGRMFTDTKNFLYYWRLTPDRRLLFGGRASFVPTTVARTSAILERALRRVHPQLSNVRTEFAWGGTVGFTFDRLPHLGRRDGVTYALGYCGQGVCMATSFGMTVAAMLGRGADLPASPSPFEEIPFPGSPVPAAYRGRPWFLPVIGVAYRARDALARR